VSSLRSGSAPTVTTPGTSDVVAFRRALAKAAPSLRRDLPWLNSSRPWAVLVSEVMLQQTSTSRVMEPWARFVEQFPTAESCASAPLAEVLVAWSGLGYPRRAKSLHEAARMIRDEFEGEVPSDVDELRRLPGVGEYTSHAVASFAFDKRVAVLDTNVGRVLARALANRPLPMSAARDLAHQLLPKQNTAAFNQAMIDLGAQFCRALPRCEACPLARSCAWQREGGADPAPLSAGVSRPQAPFVGSNRQLRGRVLRALHEGPRAKTGLVRELAVAPARAEIVLDSLVRDGLITKSARSYSLSGGDPH
jgi:A/G-specific adenine glycosylase